MKKPLLFLFFTLLFTLSAWAQVPTVSILGATVGCSDPSTAQSYTAIASNSPTSYSWSVAPAAGVTISANGTSVVTISFPNTAPTDYTINCIAANSSGSSQPGTVNTIIYQTPNITFSGATTINAGASSALSASSTMASNTMGSPTLYYTWSPPTGLNTTSGPNVIANPTVTTVYSVTVVSSLGNCSSFRTLALNVSPVGIKSYSQDNNETNVFPNPSNGEVFIKSNHGQLISVINELGQTVQTLVLIPKEEIKIVGLKPGIYFIVSTTTRKKIIVTRE